MSPVRIHSKFGQWFKPQTAPIPVKIGQAGSGVVGRYQGLCRGSGPL